MKVSKMSFTQEQMEIIREFEKFVGEYWYKKIDTNKLDLGSYKTCIFGQIYKDCKHAESQFQHFINGLIEEDKSFLLKYRMFSTNEYLQAWFDFINKKNALTPDSYSTDPRKFPKPGTQAAVWYNGEKINVTYLQGGLCMTNDWKVISQKYISTKKHVVLGNLIKGDVFWNQNCNKMIKCNKTPMNICPNGTYVLTPDNVVHIMSENDIVQIEE